MRRSDSIPTEPFDLLVIGGGCVGTAVAMFASRAGYKTALIEKDDFGAGTTGASTELIHGGLQYLFRLKLRIVRQSNEYARRVYRSASHLCRPVPIVVPCYEKGAYSFRSLRLLMRVYESFNRRYKHAPPSRRLTADEIVAAVPGIRREGLVGGVEYYEWWIDATRLCLANAQTAAAGGAWVRNHAEVVAFEPRRDVGMRVVFQDSITAQRSEIDARVVVSAAGPWTDRIAALAGLSGGKRIRPTRGAHIFLPKLADVGLMIPFIDGRFGVMLPRHEATMVGTSDDDYYGKLEDKQATADEVGYLLEGLQQLLPQVRREDVLSTKAGVRPTIYQFGKNEDKVSRGHRIERNAEANRLICVYGGKLATHTLMAEDVLDQVAEALGRPSPERSSDYRLYGAPPDNVEEFIDRAIVEIADRSGLPPETCEVLARRYGTAYRDLLEVIAEDESRLENLSAAGSLADSDPVLAGEVRYAAEAEWARTPEDVARRTGLGIAGRGGTDWRRRVVEILADVESRDDRSSRAGHFTRG